ncbi:MAG TPA: hypothetical protein VMA74_16455, partial [Dyella sp.]|uniref:hypothetical protein n=1 Tax=Dyella sp. TaxID=1869338 RepID=UPI002C4353E3
MPLPYLTAEKNGSLAVARRFAIPPRRRSFEHPQRMRCRHLQKSVIGSAVMMGRIAHLYRPISN